MPISERVLRDGAPLTDINIGVSIPRRVRFRSQTRAPGVVAVAQTSRWNQQVAKNQEGKAMEPSIGRAAPLGLMLAVFAIPDASAQERCKISWDASVSEAKYTQQLALDVGDVPGHQVRVFELHRTYTSDKPNCEGLKRVEEWDYTFLGYPFNRS
jgi:hypothetical protein